MLGRITDHRVEGLDSLPKQALCTVLSGFSIWRIRHPRLVPAGVTRKWSSSGNKHRHSLRGTQAAAAALPEGLWATVGTSLKQLQGGAEGIGAFLETAPPPYYLVYLLSAGLGLPCSEDAFVVWLGSRIAHGIYGGWQRVAYTLTIVYVGVVASDMITFGIGVLLKMGVLKRLRGSLMRDSQSLDRALVMVRKWSKLIGLIQRFSVGFRGPLCLVCGFTGVSASDFLGGAAVGALGTMPLQLSLGYLLRDSPNVYLTALALAAGPNFVGHVAGPLLTALGFWWVGRKGGNDGRDKVTLEGMGAK